MKKATYFEKRDMQLYFLKYEYNEHVSKSKMQAIFSYTPNIGKKF